MEPDPKADEAGRVGLCVSCQFAKRVESGRGSVFFLCERSGSDPTYPRYPRLPVRSCRGYEGLTPERPT